MRAEALGQSGSARTLNTGMPYALSVTGLSSSREWQFPVTRVFTPMDVDDHPLAVDVGELQPRGFSSSKTSGVQEQQDRSVAKVGCGRNQLLDFFRAEDDWKLLWYSREQHIV